MTLCEFYLWLEDRVFPPNRIGAKKILKSLGLKKYNALEIAKRTRACLMGDVWWIAMSSGDDFKECTLRGAVGFPGFKLEDYYSFKW